MVAATTPLTHAHALAPEWYVERSVYDLEVRDLLPHCWQVVAPASSLDKPGTVITRKLGNVPIVLTRDTENQLHGLVNICRHRAGPLACEERASKRHLRCAYHGWTYDLSGQLIHAPEMEEADGFDPAAIRLTQIDLREWQGLVFARLGSGEAFEDVIAGVDDLFADNPLDQLEHHSAIRYTVGANWKVYVDNYLEGYHVPFVHPDLMGLLDYNDYSTELAPWWSVQRSPVDASAAYAAGEALYFFIYPNTMLNVMPGRVQTNRVIPTGLDSCAIEFDFYYSPSEKARAADDAQFSDLVQEEDRRICEQVQTALASGAYAPGRLSPKREAAVWHFQNLLREEYRRHGLSDVGAIDNQ